MTQTLSTMTCRNCGATLPGDLLACPSCHTLVHQAQLAEFSNSAGDAQAAGDIVGAMRLWREALQLLPPGTTQAAIIQKKINDLTPLAGSAQVTRESMSRSRIGRALATFGAAGLILWKFKFLLGLILTKGKLLLLGLTNATTFLSMFTFALAYWTVYRWPFALGIALSIYVHEMGHVQALHSRGMKAGAPMFIPGLGAFIRLKQHPVSEVEDARIGLAGPTYGMIAAAACALVYFITGSPIWAALAHVGALINVFNLIPVWSLDGSRGFRSLSYTQAWWVTAALASAWLFSGDGLFLIVAVVALVRTLMHPRTGAGDTRGFIQFVLLIAGLAALTLVRAPLS